MVFLSSPKKTMDEPNTRKRCKYVAIFLLIALGITGFYLHSFITENRILYSKTTRLMSKLSKYITAFQLGENNLKTAREDVKNFHDSNVALQQKYVRLENELLNAKGKISSAESRLQDAFDFFLEVKQLLQNDASIPEDHKVNKAITTLLKKQISNLKLSQIAHLNLQIVHNETLIKLGTATKTVAVLATGKDTVERKLFIVSNQLRESRRKVDERNRLLKAINASNTRLTQTVRKLKKQIKKAKSEAKPSGVIKPKVNVTRLVPAEKKKDEIFGEEKFEARANTSADTSDIKNDLPFFRGEPVIDVERRVKGHQGN